MQDYLISQAIENVWCSPQQDTQVIIKLARVSKSYGAVRQQKILWDTIVLPTDNSVYHVFQIGHLDPRLLNIMDVTNSWKPLSDIINTTSIMAAVYFTNGIVIPRHDCFLYFTKGGNLLLAVKEQTRIDNLDTETFYMRVYSNAFFDSVRSGVDDGTTIDHVTVVGPESLVEIQVGYIPALALPGAVMAYRNGWLINTIIQADVQIGDVLEWVHDTSIYRTVDFSLTVDNAFTSILDAKEKYLLSYPADENNTTIDFQDDIDIYVIENNPAGEWKGVYYHRHLSDGIRMVTHKDYALPVSSVEGYATDHGDTWADSTDLLVRLYIRKAGYQRPLVHENGRIAELYQLGSDEVLAAMIGIDATVPTWKAENLENSSYPSVMRNRTQDINATVVQEMYGYNAISKLVGETPQAVTIESGLPVAHLPRAYHNESTIYEYDVDGQLLGFYPHDGPTVYNCTHVDAVTIEAVAGIASNALDVAFNRPDVTIVPIDSTYNYRVYMCALDGNSDPVWDWIDISNTEIVSAVDEEMVFANLTVDDYTAVMSDKNFLGYTLDIPNANGILKFSIETTETHDDVTYSKIATLPPRRLDLWLNGHPLIEGLDFTVNWPQIVVVNKAYLVVGSQKIDIRATGFCNEDLSMDPQREFGFIEHGYLSSNAKYDIRDDKVLSMVIGGKLMLRDGLEFAEFNSGVSMPGLDNGTPYSIREHIVPIRDPMYMDTYMMRAASMIIDSQISNYMTVKYPEPDIPEVLTIPQLYDVYSPFIARIIDDLQQGVIDSAPLEGIYNNMDITAWVEPYIYLLPYDPAYIGFNADYVYVHPHASDVSEQLTIYQSTFVKRVIELFLDNKVPLTGFIEITLPTI